MIYVFRFITVILLRMSSDYLLSTIVLKSFLKSCRFRKPFRSLCLSQRSLTINGNKALTGILSSRQGRHSNLNSNLDSRQRNTLFGGTLLEKDSSFESMEVPYPIPEVGAKFKFLVTPKTLKKVIALKDAVERDKLN